MGGRIQRLVGDAVSRLAERTVAPFRKKERRETRIKARFLQRPPHAILTHQPPGATRAGLRFGPGPHPEDRP